MTRTSRRAVAVPSGEEAETVVRFAAAIADDGEPWRGSCEEWVLIPA